MVHFMFMILRVCTESGAISEFTKKETIELDMSTTSDWSSNDPNYSMEISPDDRKDEKISS